jgi:hypothetical protein
LNGNTPSVRIAIIGMSGGYSVLGFGRLSDDARANPPAKSAPQLPNPDNGVKLPNLQQ